MKYGIRLGSLHMLDGPGGTIDDEWDTVQLHIECEVDHPLVSIRQPCPELHIDEMAKGMGYEVAGYDDFPEKFNRTSSIEFENKLVIENLHKWFSLVARHAWLEPLARKAIHARRLSKLHLVMDVRYSEHMVAEQHEIRSRAQGETRLRNRAVIDFARRLGTQGALRVYEVAFARYLDRFFSSKQVALSLQMGDERVVAHMD